MRDAVRRAFVAFSAPLEGVTYHLYCDVKGLVTTAIGCLVDPIETALDLPFTHPSTRTPATRAEIAAAWRVVKNAPAEMRARGGGAYASLPGNEIRLLQSGVDALVGARLVHMDDYLSNRIGDAYDHAPADAQLALLSLAWACGPAFRYPKLIAAVKAGDFMAASNEIAITPAIGTIVHRNAANKTLLRNAAHVVASGADPERLYWPASLSVPPRPADDGVLGPAAVSSTARP